MRGRSPSSPPVNDPPHDNFQERLRAARFGSSATFGALLETYRPTLLRAARRALSPALRVKEDADDVVQCTFLEAQRALPAFRGETPAQFLRWLRAILRHRVAKVHRRFARSRKRNIVREISLERGLCATADELFPDRTPPPDGVTDTKEEARRLRRALAGLPERDRRVIRLYVDEGLRFPAIGFRLNCSPDAARKGYVRAVRRLRQMVSCEMCL